MAHATALRTTSSCLLLTLFIAASSAAGQDRVPASAADLGKAWQPAASLDPRAAGLAVDVRFDLLRRAAASGGVLTLPLSDGTSLRFNVEWSQSDATQVFVAGPALEVDGDVSMTAVGDSLSGRVVVNGRVFVVRRAAGSDTHVVTELNQSALPPPGPPLVPAPEELGDPVAPDAPQDSNAFVDVMVVYTPGARAQIGSTGAMVAELTASINSSNIALANSGAVHRFRLVHHQEIAYAETNVMDTTLRRLTNTADGFMDDVPVLRKRRVFGPARRAPLSTTS